MTDQHHNDDPQAPEPQPLGLLAQYAGPDDLIDAARQVTDDGYRRVESFAPFAIIGIDEALKAKKTILPWIVLCIGLCGGAFGLAMQVYMNGTGGSWWFAGYPYTISAKPLLSIPAFMPVTFELIILSSAFASFFGMILLNGLPKLSNPLFRNERFSSATSDGFFLFVEADDPKYAEAETSAFLSSVGATAVERIDSEVEGHTVPGVIHMAGALGLTIALLPPFWLWAVSSGTTSTPRISLFYDMEDQAKAKPQTHYALFADGRAMRRNVEGTVARGWLREDAEYHLGYTPDEGFADARRVKAMLVADTDAAAPETPAEEPEPDWIKDFPLPVTMELMDRGEQRFNIYCSTCHGLGGDGDGLITQRAMDLGQGTWILPTSIHTEAVIDQPDGRIYNTITNGIRNMPGYKAQISTEDRWAIVLYLRALQRSRAATVDDVPPEELDNLTKAR